MVWAHRAAVVPLVVNLCGCDLIGPSCLARQERGTVATVRADVAAGQVVSHRVAYDARGSQNDIHFSWVNQGDAAGPRVSIYATRAECDFTAPSQTSAGACAILARGGWIDGVRVASMSITHGRGNPEQLGSPPEYKLWIVGDAAQRASYVLEITWFFGPDC